MNAVTLYFGSFCVVNLMSCFYLASSLHPSYSLLTLEHQSTTIFVDCSKGNDSSNCGSSENFPCLTLRFAVYERARHINSSHVAISIAPTVCAERDVLRFDCIKNTVKSWTLIGFNQISRQQTVIEISTIIRDCSVTFSSIHWKNSNGLISFTSLSSDIKFENSMLQDAQIQIIGLNTHIAIVNTSFDNCTSGDQNIPLFLLQTTYGYEAELFIGNSRFSNIPTPILYATQMHDITVKNTIYFKNGKSASTSGCLITIISAKSILLEDIKFNQSLRTAIKIVDVTNFTAKNLVFSLNTGSNGSCLFIHRHSNISLVHSFFESNTNPVIYVKDKDDVNITVKTCHFDCVNVHEKYPPFIQAPDGINITFVNCSKEQSCFVHCKKGEFLKSQLFCKKCPAGSFSFNQKDNVTSNSCQSCPVGTYTSKTGCIKCRICHEGTYAPNLGSKKCKKCKNEFFTSPAGAESCSKITLGCILILATSVPLIMIPIVILLGRQIMFRKSNGIPFTSNFRFTRLNINYGT